MRIALSIVFAFAACKKDSPTTTVTSKEADALWALAPSGARAGVVATPRALAMTEDAVAAIRGALAIPQLADVARQLDELLRDELGTATLTLAEYGMSRDRGGALFLMKDGMIAILPVGDRDRFLARVGGKPGVDRDRIADVTCKRVHEVYACATAEPLLDALGTGDLRPALAGVGARGDLEVVGLELPLGGARPGSVAVVAQLSRGGVAIRGSVRGLAAPLLTRFAVASRPRADLERTAGFAIVNLAPFADAAPAIPVGETTIAAAARSLNGPLTVAIPAGQAVIDARQALADPRPVRALLEGCPGLAQFAGLTATVTDGVCHVVLAESGLDLDLWVDGTTFRIGKRGSQVTGKQLAMPAIGRELAAADWGVAFWGRGTLYGPPAMSAMLGGNLPRDAALMLRAVSIVNELGGGARVDGDTVKFVIALRTAFANPDDVVAKLLAIDPAGIFDGRAGEAANQIAAAAPQSPFAADFAAGQTGLMIPTAMLGMTAAIAIPAFVNARRPARRTEAVVTLDRIGRGAKAAYVANAQFPVGDTGLVPATACCAETWQGKRACSPGDWSKPPWTALELSIDQPHLFQYSYKSDGKTFTATAVGDLDCDGTTVTYELRGDAPSGNPRVTLVEPPPNAD